MRPYGCTLQQCLLCKYTMKSQFCSHFSSPRNIPRPYAGHHRVFERETHSLLKTHACCQQGILKTALCPQSRHPMRVSLLVLIFSSIFHINSFSSKNITKQFAVINLWQFLYVINPGVKRYNVVWIALYSIRS